MMNEGSKAIRYGFLFSLLVTVSCSVNETTECCFAPDGTEMTTTREYDTWIIKQASNYDIPDDMVLVPGGKTSIGSDDGLLNEQPIFNTRVEPFLMDKHMVTVEEFRSFVEATGYVTEAQKIGDGIVFDFRQSQWVLVPGANWEFPLGPNQTKAQDGHPVTMLSYKDAVNYLNWVGKRLPTEIEWEHAARGIVDRDAPYSWGGDLIVSDSIYMANTWNGFFPALNTGDDGFFTTSPVGMFGSNELGLFDMGGNVWEWTSDWYRSYANYQEPFRVDSTSEKVLRGGSFMCHTSYCHGYRVSARSFTPPTNTMFHIGFRGVRDLPRKSKEPDVGEYSGDYSPESLSAPTSYSDIKGETLQGSKFQWKIGELIASEQFKQPEKWVFQIEKKEHEQDHKIVFNGLNYPNALEVYMPGKGATIWFDEQFEGPVMIEYTLFIPEDSMGMDPSMVMPRDANVFWHASDPSFPKSLEARMNRINYTGQFQSYHKQRGYYASMGGGSNTTTRFRRYPRVNNGASVWHVSMNDKDGNENFLLKSGTTYRIQLVATEDLVQYRVNGAVVNELNFEDEVRLEQESTGATNNIEAEELRQQYPPYLSGWFGFRILKSHHVFKDLKVYRLEKLPEA